MGAERAQRLSRVAVEDLASPKRGLAARDTATHRGTARVLRARATFTVFHRRPAGKAARGASTPRISKPSSLPMVMKVASSAMQCRAKAASGARMPAGFPQARLRRIASSMAATTAECSKLPPS